MHNCGYGTLHDVVCFYARGADFLEANEADLDPEVEGIGKVRGNEDRVNALVEFMKALTDERVRYERAPFDHPELILPNGATRPAVGANGGAPLQPFMPHQ